MWKRRRRKQSNESKTIVLGLQTAAAADAERGHRQAHPDTVSPLAGVAYDREAGEGSLFNFRPAQADDALSALATKFRASSESTRVETTAAMTTDDFSMIHTFARRQSARFLQSGDPDELSSALDALSMVDAQRIDSRDIAWAAGYIRLAATNSSTGEPAADDLFTDAAAIAQGETKDILLSFRGRSRADVERGWVMKVIERDGSPVIVGSGPGAYAPTVDLIGAATQLSSVLAADGYHGVGDPTVGDTIAHRWLDQSPGSKAILEQCVASVGLGAHFRAGDRSVNHLFLVFVFELPSSRDREAFERVWLVGKRDFASLAVGHERMLTLYIANSAMVGVDPVESDGSLGRFAEQTKSVLKATIGRQSRPPHG